MHRIVHSEHVMCIIHAVIGCRMQYATYHILRTSQMHRMMQSGHPVCIVSCSHSIVHCVICSEHLVCIASCTHNILNTICIAPFTHDILYGSVSHTQDILYASYHTLMASRIQYVLCDTFGVSCLQSVNHRIMHSRHLECITSLTQIDSHKLT